MSSQFIKAEGVGLGQNSVSRVCVSVQFAPPPSSKMRSSDPRARVSNVRLKIFDKISDSKRWRRERALGKEIIPSFIYLQ